MERKSKIVKESSISNPNLISRDSKNIEKENLKEKCKELLRNPRKKKREKSSSSSSDSDDSSASSSVSSISSSESKSRSHKHKKRSKKNKKHKSRKIKHVRKEKKSPKKSKWTTVKNSESPVITKHSIAEGETNNSIFLRDQNLITKEEAKKDIVKEEPNFKPSGLLAKETNTVK